MRPAAQKLHPAAHTRFVVQALCDHQSWTAENCVFIPPIRLAAVSRGIVGHLTPSMVGEIFELLVHASSARGWFELTTTDDALKVAMQASSPQAPIRWVEFVLVRSLGLTLAELESLYGIPYRALPPAKDGTTIVFDTSTAAVARNAYISAQLWSPRAEPASVVFQLQLRYPR